MPHRHTVGDLIASIEDHLEKLQLILATQSSSPELRDARIHLKRALKELHLELHRLKGQRK